LRHDQLEVLVHPQQIVHGLVSFRDGSVSAGMAVPDMRVAAAHCLGIDGGSMRRRRVFSTWHDGAARLRASRSRALSGARLGDGGVGQGGAMPAILNAANEIAVAAYLAGAISFPGIAALVEAVCSQSAPPWRLRPMLRPRSH
jgi:1-deoxy-D-xylulose-5-phosphate reductoisomerase